MRFAIGVAAGGPENARNEDGGDQRDYEEWRSDVHGCDSLPLE
jgi:hypothetical protein